MKLMVNPTKNQSFCFDFNLAVLDDESGMLEELSRLLCSNDRATNQAAALSLARACWGCHRSQTIVGNCKASMDGILARLVYLLRGEIESGRPGHMAWALAEVIRYHHKNQVKKDSNFQLS